MKKRILSVVLVVVMLLAMGMTSMAAEKHFTTVEDFNTKYGESLTLESDTVLPFEDQSDVLINVDPEDPAKIYYVVVNWDSLIFSYDFVDAPTWDPTEHKYVETTNAKWDKTAAEITVTNHSNNDVTASASFSQSISDLEEIENNVRAKLDMTSFDLLSGEGLAFDSASNGKFTLKIDGVPNVTGNFKLGTVYLKIDAK